MNPTTEAYLLGLLTGLVTGAVSVLVGWVL